MNKRIFIFLLLILILIIVYGYNYKKELFTPLTQLKIIDIKLPNGKWKNNCKLVCWNPPILTADCKDDLGHYHNSSINVGSCYTKEVHADYGHLDCH